MDNDLPSDSNLKAGTFLRNIRALAIAANVTKRAARNTNPIGHSTAFVDQDESGTYDPTEAENLAVRRKKTKQPRAIEPSDDEDEIPKPKAHRRPRAFDGMVTLTFRSKNSLKKFPAGPYSDVEESDSESESEVDQPSPPLVRPRRFVSCNHCRNGVGGAKRCSLKSKQDSGPCSNCRKVPQHCEFVIIPPSQLQNYEQEMAETRGGGSKKHGRVVVEARNHKRARRDDEAETHTHKLYSEVENRIIRRAKKQNQNARAGSSHIFIDTHFCHPIVFNYQPENTHYEPCSWCSNPLYGIHGLGPSFDCDTKHVEGFYDSSGKGFNEIFGGFSEAGATQTKMCTYCSWERIKIISCEIHTIRKISDEELGGWVYDWNKFSEAAQKFNDGDLEGARYYTDAQWCGLCPSFATHKCASPFDCADDGCGVKLCDGCANLESLMSKGGITEGSKMLDRMITEIGNSKWQFDLGLRADAVFLTSSGELASRLRLGFGVTTEDYQMREEAEDRGSKARKSDGELEQLKRYDARAVRRAQKKQKELDDSQESVDRSKKPRLDKGKGKAVDSSGTIATSSVEPVRRITKIADDQADTRKYQKKDVYAHLERGNIRLGGIIEPTSRDVAVAFGGFVVDLTEDD